MNRALTPDEHAALPEILRLLGLENSKLSLSEKMALCDRFYSVLYVNRRDGDHLKDHLNSILLSLNAVSRGESEKVIFNSPDLLAVVQQIQLAARYLAPRQTDCDGAK